MFCMCINVFLVPHHLILSIITHCCMLDQIIFDAGHHCLHACHLLFCNLSTRFPSFSIPYIHPAPSFCTRSPCSHSLAVIQVCKPTNTYTRIYRHTQTLREVAKLQPASLISLVAPSRTLNHVIRKLIQSPKQDSRRQFLFIHLLLYLGLKEEVGIWF